MAKSPLSGTKKAPKSTSAIEAIKKNIVSDIDLKFKLQQRNSINKVLWNLRDWCHLKCAASNSIAKPNRITRMQKLGHWVKEQKTNGVSELTITMSLFALRRYIIFCDNQNVDPFSKVGYLSYAGNTGELWHQVGLAISPNRYTFQCHDGQELGILENSAYQLKLNTDATLLITGFDVSEFQVSLKSFSQGKRDELTGTQPYSSNEWESLIRRTQYYFESLSDQLIAYQKNNPSSPPPLVLERVVVDKIDGNEVVTKVIGISHGGGASSPFNQCMCAGYTLFAYYTAFNDSVIQAVRHPLKTITGKKEGRSMDHIKVKAYKGRSSKEVKAMFTDLIESDHPEATGENDTGYIVADIDKRGASGGGNGLIFIETLRMLSKAYSDDTYGRLIYNLDGNGEKKGILIHDALAIMSSSLGLLSDDRVNLKDYLLECFIELLNNQQINEFKKTKNEAGNIVISKQLRCDFSSPQLTSLIPRLGIAVASCMTDIQLKNILMPLRYSGVDAEGDITIFFSYLNGTTGYFHVAHEYQCFFESLEAYAQSRNSIPRPTKGRKGSTTKPPFLFPLGSKHLTHQWKGVSLPISTGFLLRIGVTHGDFYLSVTSGQIRVTHSDLEYNPDNGGLNARKILQHGKEAQGTRYVNGHPVVNVKQASQGMQGLENISGGMSRDEALKELKKTQNISVIAYEVWKARQMPTNPNGIACNGKIDLTEGKNKHYAAKKFAERERILGENQEITCYQYDLCVFCKSAQLVDDPYAIYKLLSFLDAIRDSIDRFPERADFIDKKVARFQLLIDTLPYQTIEQAEALFEEHGRYPLFNSNDSVIQHL